jgi:hypothetical protein
MTAEVELNYVPLQLYSKFQAYCIPQRPIGIGIVARRWILGQTTVLILFDFLLDVILRGNIRLPFIQPSSQLCCTSHLARGLSICSPICSPLALATYPFTASFNLSTILPSLLYEISIFANPISEAKGTIIRC